MISFLQGKVIFTQVQSIIVQTSGIGFAVSVPNEQLFSVTQKVTLWIYFHWHQEQGPQLFGFTSELAKTVFILILSCSGIGPKIALSLLAHLTPEAFLQAIELSDQKALSSISGIGPKKAELIIMHLKNKTGKIISIVSTTEDNKQLIKIKELNQALSSLNYSRQEISAALEYLKQQNIFTSGSFDELLRKALSFLAKRL